MLTEAGHSVDEACLTAVQQFAVLLEQHETKTGWDPLVAQQIRGAQDTVNRTFLQFFGRTMTPDQAADAYLNVNEIGDYALDSLNQKATKLMKQPAAPLHQPKMRAS